MDEMIKLIRESAEEIIADNRNGDRDLLMLLYQRGFSFMSNQSDQSIVDIGSIGLAYAVRRATHAEG